MYPYTILGTLDLYAILIAVGGAGCLLLVRFLADRRGLSDALTNLILLSGIFGMAAGYGAAVLFQSVYDFIETGEFILGAGTGATFYGGLIGGACGFLVFYFAVGHFVCRRGEHLHSFFTMAGLSACGITFAHGFGRIGCLMAGCCYGAPTEAWYGIYMVGLGYRVIPTQLIEAIFLFALTGLLVYLVLHGRRGIFSLYMAAYGVFRFLIEYWRDDDRGASLIPGLSPSQLTACLMLLGAAILYFVERRLTSATSTAPASTAPAPAAPSVGAPTSPAAPIAGASSDDPVPGAPTAAVPPTADAPVTSPVPGTTTVETAAPSAPACTAPAPAAPSVGAPTSPAAPTAAESGRAGEEEP